jgi:hypothetical protein
MARREDPLDPARPIQGVPAPKEADPTWERLESQLKWYSQSSRTAQRWYKRLKLLELGVAAVLPVVAGLGSAVWVTGRAPAKWRFVLICAMPHVVVPRYAIALSRWEPDSSDGHVRALGRVATLPGPCWTGRPELPGLRGGSIQLVSEGISGNLHAATTVGRV